MEIIKKEKVRLFYACGASVLIAPDEAKKIIARDKQDGGVLYPLSTHAIKAHSLNCDCLECEVTRLKAKLIFKKYLEKHTDGEIEYKYEKSRLYYSVAGLRNQIEKEWPSITKLLLPKEIIGLLEIEMKDRGLI